ncbi:hypothetical protein [Aureibacter tunicatorum]|uniref:Uncharacterized protein n=1 Tax=Aureibacter tunicatorum TaxID=866807 RepID=A0AAE3XIP9_9BACT|nr:hypothetical protein [Aureibacter tunicatorum]MDR6237557.1 hypothetical protein [Aureibacter tunicatorum]BDD02591.1 hypothetical protein AUTU_00740 [Aureibacter tunicatorum]
MNYKFIFCFFLILNCAYIVNAQDFNFRKIDTKAKKKEVKRMHDAIMSVPEPYKFGYGVRNDSIFYSFYNENYLRKIFKKNTFLKGYNDGVLIDILTKKECLSATDKLEFYKNRPAIFMRKSQIYKNMKKVDDNRIEVFCGVIPEEYKYKEIEMNITFVKRRMRVIRVITFNPFSHVSSVLPFINLVEMSVPKSADYVIVKKIEESFFYFEENKSILREHDKVGFLEQIKDQLNDGWTVTGAKLTAFASVEGKLEDNQTLYKDRAQTVENCIKGYLPDNYKIPVKMGENWRQFKREIKGTAADTLLRYSKEEVKKIINENNLNDEMEHYLAPQRYVKLTTRLEKQMLAVDYSDLALLRSFEDGLREKRLKINDLKSNQAMIIKRILDKKIDFKEYLKIEIPDHSSLIDLKFNNLLLKTKLYPHADSVIIAYDKMIKLKPNDNRLKYNWVVYKQLYHRYEEKSFERIKKYTSILKNGEFNTERLELNNLLIELKHAPFKPKHRENIETKILNMIDSMKLRDKEKITIAYYTVSANSLKPTIKLMEELIDTGYEFKDFDIEIYVRCIIRDFDEENSKHLKMLNLLLERDKSRFCDIYSSYLEGGVTFQLLLEQYFKKQYLETCEENIVF